MGNLLDQVIIGRVQFAYTALFHILWPVLIVGLSIFLVVLESLWLITKNDVFYYHARFWIKIFLLNLSVGVVTGIPLEFQFGTNWSEFSKSGGDIFGHLLGFEATIAFMLEASFLSMMAFGWQKGIARDAPFFYFDGGPGGEPFGILDHDLQCLDADPGRGIFRELEIPRHEQC